MTIPTISTLPTAPARTDAPATFITRADAFLAAIVTMQSELNTSIGAMNTDIAQANTDATAAAASASAAATSESNASTSESNAATSETNAASSAAAAASSYDQFDDRYLGSKASDPAVDNDGNALLTGALYFNTTSDDMKVYTGSTWKVTGFNPDSPTFTDTVTAPSFDINSIAATNADTATDVFVYDTRKDSDGGAWRKRTQHTSWYNETLDTATRGSRKEFPAVAVIVAETNQVTIYDGDDPSLPMWMVFNGGFSTYSTMLGAGTVSSLYALNAQVGVGTTGGTGFRLINFLNDNSYVYDDFVSSGLVGLSTATIEERNEFKIMISSGAVLIVNDDINDVAMTVLPNAPIDAATGLPVPTIAVATVGGVSVIKDDGTVVSNGSYDGSRIAWTPDYKILTNAFENFTPADAVFVVNVGSTLTTDRTYRTTTVPSISNFSNTNSGFDKGLLAYDNYLVGANYVDGNYPHTSLVMISRAETQPIEMVNYITSTYNTGWMNGDIKLATLSDTDDTDVTGSKLVTGDAASDDTDSIGSWVNSGMSVLESSTAFTNGSTYALHFTADGNGDDVYVSFPTVIGKTYTISFDAYATNYSGSSTLGTFIGTNITGSQYTSTYATVTSASTWTKYTATFTATTTTAYLTFIEGGSSNNIDAYIDNLSVRIAVEDRSVNDNGLQVFGTITKDPVATGADLVAYSGFSASNYLEQPYNSDLDFGTGDFCVMGWCTPEGSGSRYIFDSRDQESGATGFLLYRSSNGGFQLTTYDSGPGTGVLTNTQTYLNSTQWTFVTGIRRNGVLEIYVNGKLDNTDSGTVRDVDNTSRKTTFGISVPLHSYHIWPGSLALWRISATAPTAEQIAKIYNDEKVLFQENSQATLYGSSDAVTALAYDDDTELLHVGTSAGRSVFQGLRRVDNTTGAVGAAISASNGLVAED